jgi:hypothetical protein
VQSSNALTVSAASTWATGSGAFATLDVVAADLWKRLVDKFLLDAHGRRPCVGAIDRLQTDPRWRDGVLFFEYFNGDDGTGLVASHPTGWTALVADVIRRRHGSLPSVGEIIASAMRDDAELK